MHAFTHKYTHTQVHTHTTHTLASSGSHTICGRIICIIMKLKSAVSLLEAGGCVLSTACRTSGLLAHFDPTHWDTAGTASVKMTLLCFLLFNKDSLSSHQFLIHQPPDLCVKGKILGHGSAMLFAFLLFQVFFKQLFSSGFFAAL